MQQGGDERREGLAMGGDQSDRVAGGRLGDGNDGDLAMKAEDFATFFGMMLHQRPVRIWENSPIIEFDSSFGSTVTPASAKCWLMIRRFCMSAVNRQRLRWLTSLQVTLSRSDRGLPTAVTR